jgi:hypothetical protein
VKGSGDAVGRTNLSLKTLDSLTATMEKRAGRKLMIWVSPGWPLLTGPNTQLSTEEERQIFQSIVAASLPGNLIPVTRSRHSGGNM